jgi:uncharacterized protein YlaN (UPF0358 family)
MDVNMTDFKHIVDKDVNHKETVSFNFPKYQEMGTPHEVWSINVDKVEECLEAIIENQPWGDEYPLIHMRREEMTDDGLLIRVHLDLHGKTTMVKFAMQMLNRAVNVYVSLNMIASDKGKELLENVPPELAELMKNPSALVDILPVTGDPNDGEAIKAQIMKALEAKGIDPANVKLVGPGAEKLKEKIKVADDSLTLLDDDDVPTGPLDFSKANEVDSGEKSGGFPFLLMPNPNPEDIN